MEKLLDDHLPQEESPTQSWKAIVGMVLVVIGTLLLCIMGTVDPNYNYPDQDPYLRDGLVIVSKAFYVFGFCLAFTALGVGIYLLAKLTRSSPENPRE